MSFFYRYEVEALGHKVTNKGLLPSLGRKRRSNFVKIEYPK